jgi:hypothetical protein
MIIRIAKNCRLPFKVFHPKRMGSKGSKILSDMCIASVLKIFISFCCSASGLKEKRKC